MDAVIYITDKTGKKGWNTLCTYGYHQGELANLNRHLSYLKAGHYAYLDRKTGKPLYDSKTVKLVMEVDGKLFFDSSEVSDISDVDLLASLLEG